MRIAEAWAELVDAMATHEPACKDLDLFIADEHTRADIAACAAVCAECPLLPECDAYARVARPTAGVWAGKKRNGRRSKGDDE